MKRIRKYHPATRSRTVRVALLLLLISTLHSPHSTLHAQIGNLVGLDEKQVHFGIQVGYSQSKFDLHFADDPELRQMLQGTSSYYNAGFHIAVIGDLKAWRYINLRFCPGVTLIGRSLSFSWEEQYHQLHPHIDTRRNVESVYGELPLDIKFRAARWRNFRPYLTAGTSYGFDFASLRNNKNNTDESIIRLGTSDFRYTAGVGFDFYLRYVKFAIELKMAFGLTDLKIDDDNLVTLSYDNLHSRTFMLGFTFEG